MIGPAGFMAAPAQARHRDANHKDYPAFGTAPIRCGRSRCPWRGFETLLAEHLEGSWTRKLCPLCGCDNYSFMTAGEINAWERRKRTAPSRGNE